MLASLSTSNMILLGAFCIGFSALALVVSMVIPRFRPDFPGKGGLKLFLVGAMACTAAVLLAVEFWAIEQEEPHAENVPHATAEK